jgi:hypothetical protein
MRVGQMGASQIEPGLMGVGHMGLGQMSSDRS